MRSTTDSIGTPFKGDLLPDGVDYVVLNGAGNSGVSQSIKWLQRALGPLYKGAIDGVMGFSTLDALKGVNNHDALIARICDQRLNFLRHLKTCPGMTKVVVAASHLLDSVN